jgi:NitT/TauT family transport system substrate-binding protein
MKLSKLLLTTALLAVSLTATAKDNFKFAWSHYTGWEPWGYAQDKGIIKKWADKYGITIEVQLINDYIESINLYTAGTYDGVTATNMDALTIPAVGGVDTTALIIGDYSNGNDGIVARNAASIKDLKGREVRLVELSVSHYMLSRALDMNGMSERDLKVVNQSDADIAAVYVADANGAVVTWNPPLQKVRNAKGSNLLFDSSKIPGEIVDIAFVRSDADERFKKALTGAWYETMATMTGKGKDSRGAIEYMASLAGGTKSEFQAQLKTTAMYYQPAEAAKFSKSDELKNTMQYVRQFSFDKGLFGNGAKSPDFVGIEFANGDVLGDKANIKLRFTSKYMDMAADGSL